MLQPRDLLPHFDVTNLEGQRFFYSTIWQRKNLVLVSLPDADPESARYAAELTAQMPAPTHDTHCVMTRERLAGFPSPGVVVADRWGEICFLAGGGRVRDLPSPRDLIDWVAHVRSRCPECEGEAK
jgi:hypothetical protein